MWVTIFLQICQDMLHQVGFFWDKHWTLLAVWSPVAAVLDQNTVKMAGCDSGKIMQNKFSSPVT